MPEEKVSWKQFMEVTSDSISRLPEELDEVAEENAEEFVRNYAIRERAGELRGARLLRFVNSVVALALGMTGECDLARPTSKIAVRPGPDGDLVYECEHQPPHQWSMADGRRQDE